MLLEGDDADLFDTCGDPLKETLSDRQEACANQHTRIPDRHRVPWRSTSIQLSDHFLIVLVLIFILLFFIGAVVWRRRGRGRRRRRRRRGDEEDVTMGRERSADDKSVFEIEFIHHRVDGVWIRDDDLEGLEEDTIKATRRSKGEENVESRCKLSPVFVGDDCDPFCDLQRDSIVVVFIVLKTVDRVLDVAEERTRNTDRVEGRGTKTITTFFDSDRDVITVHEGRSDKAKEILTLCLCPYERMTVAS